MAHAPRGLLNEKSCGVGRGRTRAVVGALEALGESLDGRRGTGDGSARGVAARGGPVGCFRASFSAVGVHYDAVAIALAERGRDGFGEARAHLLVCREAIDDHEQLADLGQVDALGGEVVHVEQASVGDHAEEALGTQILHHRGVRDLGGEAEREADEDACAGRVREELRDHRLDRVGGHLASAHRAEGVSHARPQQAQVVVDLGGGADGRARRLRRILLLDRHRGGDPLDRVDVGLLHALEELTCVRRQRLHVASLPLGVDRIEGKR